VKRVHWFVVFVLSSGCVPASPALSIRDRVGLGAYMAYQAVTAEKPPEPPAPPKPDEPDDGESCSECSGTGRLGDGTVSVACGACNGTGKKQAGPVPSSPAKPAVAPKAAAAPPPPAAAAAKPIAYRKVCRNGVCTLEPIP
jgi:hypothetical protein